MQQAVRAQGPGRLNVINLAKTICTTNTAWSGTRKMTAALGEHLGAEAQGGAHAFPTAEAMAATDDQFYGEVLRAGHRGPYLQQLAADVASGTVDLEALNDPDLPDDEAAVQLLALPGVGPYAAAHVMLTSLGRYSRSSSTRGRGRRTRSCVARGAR